MARWRARRGVRVASGVVGRLPTLVSRACAQSYAKLASLAAKPPAAGIHAAASATDVAALLARTPLAKVVLPSVQLTFRQRSALELAVADRRRPTDGGSHAAEHVGGNREGHVRPIADAPAMISELATLDSEHLRPILASGARAGGAVGSSSASCGRSDGEAQVERAASELRLVVSGDTTLLAHDRVRVKPPKQMISAACSFATERRSGLPANSYGEIVPLRCTDEAAQEKWLASCALDILQRAALHHTDFPGRAPERLELSIVLIDPQRRAEPPSRNMSASMPVDGSVTRAVRRDALRYEVAHEDAPSAAERQRCVSVVVQHAQSLMSQLVTRARDSFHFPIERALLKKLSLVVLLPSPSHAKEPLGLADIRAAFRSSQHAPLAIPPSGPGEARETPIALGRVATASAVTPIACACPPPSVSALAGSRLTANEEPSHRPADHGSSRLLTREACDHELMPPPPPKRPRHPSDPAMRGASAVGALTATTAHDDTRQAASAAVGGSWVVSVRAVADPGTLSTPTRFEECETMQRRLLSALRTHFPKEAKAAWPLLPDQVILLTPLTESDVDEAVLRALRADLLGTALSSPTKPPPTKPSPMKPSPITARSDAEGAANADEHGADEGSVNGVGAVGVGVGRTRALALAAASVAVRSLPDGGVTWLRSADDELALLGARPCHAIVPTLRLREVIALSSEGIELCADLLHLGEARLRERFGPDRAPHIIHAATTALPVFISSPPTITAERVADASALPMLMPLEGAVVDEGMPLDAHVSRLHAGASGVQHGAGGLHFDGSSVPVDMRTGSTSMPAGDPDPVDAEGWQLPSCSQVDPETIAEIPGPVGEQLRERHAKLVHQRQREASQSEARAARGDMSEAAPRTGPAPGSDEAWACSVCTYLHVRDEALFLACAACGTERRYRCQVTAVPPIAPEVARTSLAPPPPSNARPPFARGSTSASARRARGRSGRQSGRGGGATTAMGGQRSPLAIQLQGVPSHSPSAGVSGGAFDDEEANAATSHRVRSLHFGCFAANLETAPDGALSNENVHAPQPHTLPEADALDEPESWDDVRPYIREWLQRGERPDSEVVLAYARALVRAWRLDDLGCLVRLLEREGRPWPDLLHTFCEGVEASLCEHAHGRFLVDAELGAAHFQPLDALRKLLTDGT